MKYSDGYLDPSKETRWQTEMLFASNMLRQIQQAKKTALVSVSHCTVEPSWRFYLTLFVYMLYIYINMAQMLWLAEVSTIEHK